MDLTAIYELPVPIWVTCTALGRKYSSGTGNFKFDVVMPENEGPMGAAPVIDGVDIPDAKEGKLVVWAQEFGAHIPESLCPATALHRVVVSATGVPVDPKKNWRTGDHQLADSVDWWFDDVRTWAEVLTWQDLDPRHRVYDAEEFGAGLTFLEPAHQGSLGVRITTSQIRPLDPEEWEAILGLVRDGKEAPLEEVLARDGRAAANRGQHRRAIIDAATALEIVLTRVLEGMRDQLPEKQSKGLDERPTLGKLIDIAQVSKVKLDVPFEDLKSLSKARNNAAHFGKDPGYQETWRLLRVSLDFLGAHGLILRSGEPSPDGSELVVGG